MQNLKQQEEKKKYISSRNCTAWGPHSPEPSPPQTGDDLPGRGSPQAGAPSLRVKVKAHGEASKC